MTNSHRFTFFGRNMGLIIRSYSKTQPYVFFHFIKRKLDGEWEKSSKNQGKKIKFSLEEIIFILHVATRKRDNWKTVHIYSNNKTEIILNWEKYTYERLWISADNYSKVLHMAEIELFKRLLNHILKEKIAFSTNTNNLDDNERSKNLLDKKDKNLIKIRGRIKRTTKKAILIAFNLSNEAWIPKSAIENDINTNLKADQFFLIKDWLLKRKAIIP